MGQILFDPVSGLDKVQTISIVFFNTCSYGKHIRIKNNIFGRKANLVNQNIIAALTNLLATFKVIGLTLLIKGHYHNCRTMLLTQSSALYKFLFAFFKADGVHHSLTLNAFKSSLDYLPFGGIHHNGYS